MSNKTQEWIDTKKKYRLSDVHIQMARELGMNHKKIGSLANHKQEQWKAPLPEFIEVSTTRDSEKNGRTLLGD